MAKLTKKQIKEHEECWSLLNKGNLTHEEKLFVLEKFREDGELINSKFGAFFTPFELAIDLASHLEFEMDRPIKVLDLCAGIGCLSYAVSLFGNAEITCVELNEPYYKAGKLLNPHFNWINGDALDDELIEGFGKFDYCISNPPFGRINGVTNFEYEIIKIGSKTADNGVYIIPQTSAPFEYSGNKESKWLNDCKSAKFTKDTGVKLNFGLGVNTEVYKNQWKGTSVLCEIVTV